MRVQIVSNFQLELTGKENLHALSAVLVTDGSTVNFSLR